MPNRGKWLSKFMMCLDCGVKKFFSGHNSQETKFQNDSCCITFLPNTCMQMCVY